ncbi:MAG TPA: BACON domain-containing protein, partial [Blastocatellia bacterium]|nr:BACON domain-containing protein [Blastocatellia bacterium]
IAFNGFTGVRVDSSSINNSIRGNSIHSNAQRGIDLVAAGDPAGGVTPNDNCDPDSGPNNLQNYPVLTSATSSGANVMVAGSLNSAANTTFRIDIFSNSVCDGSGNGEGQTYLGFTIVTTDAGCTANFNINLIANVAEGHNITATATNPANNTSEFSGCVQVACGYAISPTTQFFSTRGGQGSVNILAGGSSCAWSATTKDDWIAITSADSGNGNDIATFEVRENFTGSARQGSINISGQTCTVVQDGDLGEECQYSINPKFETISAAGGTGMVSVTAAGQCAWQAVSSANWITITSGGVGIGNGTVTYSVGANAGASGRSGRITIGGQAFAIKQRGN